MWEWVKLVAGVIGEFFKPLLKRFLQRAGQVVIGAAKLAVAEVQSSAAGKSWDEKLKLGVNAAIKNLEGQGLALGIDFFLNDVVAAIAAEVENYWKK